MLIKKRGKDIMSSETILKSENPERSLEKLYMNLGKAYYEGGYEDPLPQLLEYFDEITELKNLLSGQTGVLENQQDNSLCPRCGYNLEEEAAFCGNCGYKIGGK